MGLSFADTKREEEEVLMGKVRKCVYCQGDDIHCICDVTAFQLSFRKGIDLLDLGMGA